MTVGGRSKVLSMMASSTPNTIFNYNISTPFPVFDHACMIVDSIRRIKSRTPSNRRPSMSTTRLHEWYMLKICPIVVISSPKKWK